MLAFTHGTTQALCIDLGGLCSPAATAATESCHEQAPGTGVDPDCSSCVDIPVPEEVAARWRLPDKELRAPTATQTPFSTPTALVARQATQAATVPPLSVKGPEHPSLRSTVLLI